MIEPDIEDFEFTLTLRALRQIKAEAWEQGYAEANAEALQDGTWGRSYNPYRQAVTTWSYET